MRTLTAVVLAGSLLMSCADRTAPTASPTNGTHVGLSVPLQVVSTIEIGRAYSIAGGATGLWAANYEDGELVRVDPRTNEVDQRIPVARVLGSGASDLHPVDGSLWLAASDSQAVGYLDERSLQPTLAADTRPAGYLDMAAAPGQVWLAAHSGYRDMDPVRVDGTEIRSALAEVTPPGKFALYSDIAAGDAGVWAMSESDGALAAIAPATGEPRLIATGDERFMGGSADIAVGHGSVWVATSTGDSTRIARFDPVTEEIVTTSVGGQDGIITIGPEGVWVLTHDDANGYVHLVEPATMETRLAAELPGAFSSSDIAYGFGSVWVTHDFNYVTRLGPEGKDPGEGEGLIAARGSGDTCDQGGPWTDCDEATWMRRVVLEADLEVIGDTGSAWKVRTGSLDIFLWNTSGERDVEEVAGSEGYEPTSAEGVYSDGTRLLWEAQGLHVYGESMTATSVDLLPDEVVDKLVEVSRSLPRKGDLSGAKPQPQPTGDQRFESLPNGNVRVWPVTEDVPNDGKYLFVAPHCGLDWMLDFDASFWRAVRPDDYGKGERYPFFYNSDEGAVTFTGDNRATYQASTGETIELERIDGPIEIYPCA